MDEIRSKVSQLADMLDDSDAPKAFDWWAIAALVMQLLQMILDKFKPTPVPNP